MHRATGRFRRQYEELPEDGRALADKSFGPLKNNPQHPSLQPKRVGVFWSARVGLGHRALAIQDGDDYTWVWIGTHDEYKRMIRRR